MKKLDEIATFVKELRTHSQDIGAIVPSSRALARALVRGIPEEDAPGGRRVLEVGPGTGSLTREFLKHLRPGDRLDLCEVNPSFVAFLRKRLEEDPVFRDRRGQIQIHSMRIEDLDRGSGYDHVISGLPMSNFSPEAVDQILAHLLALLVPGGTLTYYEYVGMRRIGAVFAGPEARRRFQAVDRVMRKYRMTHEAESLVVLRNLPPAWAHTLRRPKKERARA